MVDGKKPPLVRRSTLELAAQGSGRNGDKESPPIGTTTVRIPPPSERWEPEGPALGRTMKMNPPASDLMADATLDVSTGAPAGDAVSRARQAARPPSPAEGGIELVVVDEKQLALGERRPWRAAEVWTKRRVYGLDSTFRCIEVLDRETGRPEPGHELVGARLGGGRQREKDKVRFSYPLPLAGMEAMFSKGKKHGYTSAVERMIVRVRVLHTSADEATPSWEDIASRWSDAPPRP